MRVAIVGAGVIGLTVADTLMERGHHVTVFFAEPPFNTTSSIATAIWHVYLVDPSDVRNLEWARKTLVKLMGLAKSTPASGVYLVEGLELFRNSEPSEPSWSAIPPKFEMLSADEVREFDGVRWGYKIAAPLAEMPMYLTWLYRRVWQGGAKLRFERVASLSTLGKGFDVIVNATGLGARSLTEDVGLSGVRGQYLVLERPPDISDLYIGDDDNPGGMAYVIPRRNDVMIGGTEEYGIEELSFDRQPAEILDRCSTLAPWLKNPDKVAIRETVVGLRPWRPSGVRIDVDSVIASVPVVHCYGHGGSGFSMSWGCAESVANLIGQL